MAMSMIEQARNHTGIDILRAFMDPDNLHSIRILEKCGLKCYDLETRVYGYHSHAYSVELKPTKNNTKTKR